MVLLLIFISAVFIVILYLYIFNKHTDGSLGNHTTISSTFYNIIAAIGLVATGIWVVSTFNILSQRDFANAQLKDLKVKLRNIESSKLELSTEVVPYSDSLGLSKNVSKGLIVKIKITNMGNSSINFDLSKSPLKIYEVLSEDIKIGYTKLYEPQIFTELAQIGSKEKNTPLDAFVSLISSERTLSYFTVLPANKMYYIVFKTEAGDLSNHEDSIDKLTSGTKDSLKCDSDTKCKWFASKFIFVE